MFPVSDPPTVHYEKPVNTFPEAIVEDIRKIRQEDVFAEDYRLVIEFTDESWSKVEEMYSRVHITRQEPI